MTILQINWTLIVVGAFIAPSTVILIISVCKYLKYRKTHTVYYCDNYACKKYGQCEHGLNISMKKTMNDFYYFRQLQIDIFEVEKNECKQFKEPKE